MTNKKKEDIMQEVKKIIKDKQQERLKNPFAENFDEPNRVYEMSIKIKDKYEDYEEILLEVNTTKSLCFHQVEYFIQELKNIDEILKRINQANTNI